MKPASFVHHAPTSVEEATSVLAEVGHDGKVLAGGQSLIPLLNMRLASPAHLVDINRVAGLDTVEISDGAVRVGALVRHAALERSTQAYAALPLLRQALLNVAHPAIRNRGTTVGSIAHADAAGEMPAILALCEGVVEVAGARGSREIAWRDFFLGPLETSLAPEELAVAVRFGRFDAGARTAFVESARRHGDYAIAGVGVAVTVTDGVVSRAQASLVSVTEVPAVLDLGPVLGGLETAGADWERGLEAAADAVRGFVDPETDIHASGEYRRMLAAELTRRALTRAAPSPSPANGPFGGERVGVPPSSTTNRQFDGIPANGRLGGIPANDALGGIPANDALGGIPANGRLGGIPANGPFVVEQVGVPPSSTANGPFGEAGGEGEGRELMVTVNGLTRTATVPARRLLSDLLRHDLRLTGTHVGCEHGVCGACTVLVDGAPMRSCLMFAVSAQGHDVTTVEGLCSAPDARTAPTGESMNPVQQAFTECHGLQCGFCTPGFLTTITAYLDENPAPTAEEAREAISGNLCRCTGYQNIVKSVLRAAELRDERQDERQGSGDGDPAERPTASSSTRTDRSGANGSVDHPVRPRTDRSGEGPA